MRTWHFVIFYLIFGSAASLYGHVEEHGAFNWLQATIAVFLIVNILICLFEMALFFRIDYIIEMNARYHAGERGPEVRQATHFATTPLTLRSFFSWSHWANIWVGYSISDPAYKNRESFGVTVDSGNGFITLIPSVILLIGMTYPILPPLALGIIGTLMFYQQLYLTVLYFVAYIANKHYRGKDLFALVIWVGLLNGLWLLIPAIGLYAFIRVIVEDSLAIFW